MSYLRSMPNQTMTRRLCLEDCACSTPKVKTYIGLNAFSGKDVEREQKRRANKRSKV
jgi:hypothetical protein